jgi:4'-phosphopantetheinyl transferase
MQVCDTVTEEPMSQQQPIAKMDHETLQLWCAYPSDVAVEEVERACTAVLSQDERTRMEAFRFDRSRREYLTTHALVRIALSHNCSVAPESWSFRLNAYGKPTAEPDCGLRFNSSNCPDLVVCLIAQGRAVGVDAEPYGRAGQIAELANEVFSPQELAQLDRLCEGDRFERALSLWTLKEAYIKARGTGLSLPLRKLSFLFGDREGMRLELHPDLGDEAERWRFCLLERAAHRIALMIESAKAPVLQLWEVRPVLAKPTRLAALAELWQPSSTVLP